MLNRYVTKIVFCGMCVAPLSIQAEILEGSPVSFNPNNYMPYESGVPRYPTLGQEDFIEYEEYLIDEREVSQTEFPVYAPPPSSFDRYEEAYQPLNEQLEEVRFGLKNTIDYLVGHNLNRTISTKSINVSHRHLADTADALMNWQGALTPDALQNNFHLVDLAKNNRASSKFTGYYTPTIPAQLYSDAEYRYPIYRSPMSRKRLLTRQAITAGALANQGLEIAWTNDPVGLFYMQIQGSGVLEFANGAKKALKFDGSNERRFVSIATYMQNRGLINGNPSRKNIKRWLDSHPYNMANILNVNPRYIYFTLNKGDVKTASGLPVIPGHTVAVDTNYIPFGSVILAEVPITNSLGAITGSDWRILFPQDRGNAIKGPARMDIYTGSGESARKIANNLTGYGRAYLLLNKNYSDSTLTAVFDDQNNGRL